MIKTQNPSKITLKILIAVFILPIFLAYITYYYFYHFNLKTTQHGQLLSPPIRIHSSYLSDSGQWQLVEINSHSTVPSATVQKIHLALGKHQSKLRFQALSAQQMPHLTEGEIGIVDPKGFLVMQYSKDTDPKSILKDLKRLIGATHVH